MLIIDKYVYTYIYIYNIYTIDIASICINTDINKKNYTMNSHMGLFKPSL